MNPVRIKKAMRGFTAFIEPSSDRITLHSKDGVGKYSIVASTKVTQAQSDTGYIAVRSRHRREGVVARKR